MHLQIRPARHPLMTFILAGVILVVLGFLMRLDMAGYTAPVRLLSLHLPQPSVAGDVWAWGDNAYGQAGTDDGRAIHSLPVLVPRLSNVTAIAAGGDHVLALRRNGTVVTWGNDASLPGYTMLSYHYISTRPVYASRRPVPVFGLVHIAAIAAGGDFGLALRRDGRVFAFGHNAAGQFGDGTTINRRPVMVAGLSGIVAIAAGYLHGLALSHDGTVYAWGRNNSGQLGDGTTTDHPTPIHVPGVSEIITVAAGGGRSLALRRDGRVYAWGGDITPESSPDSYLTRPVYQPHPTLIPGLTNVVAIAAGESDIYGDTYYVGGASFNLALRRDGTVIAWGTNLWGQLGHALPAIGKELVIEPPARVRGVSHITALAAGFGSAFALAADGSVWAWGLSEKSQLGLQATSLIASRESTIPRHVPILTGVVAIAAGRESALALVVPHGSAAEVAATTTARAATYHAAVTAVAVAAGNATAVAQTYATARAAGPYLPGATTPAAVTRLGTPPRRQPSVPPRILSAQMRCGHGDLDVGPQRVVVLGGVRRYRHVCVHDGGVLVAATSLTLEAQTISIDASSQLSADGTSGNWTAPTRGGCPPGRTTRHPGHPGAGTRIGDVESILPIGYAGLGGGTTTLVARRIIVQGTLSATGAAGQPWGSEHCPDDGCDGTTDNGAGGGNGGAIRLVAAEVDLTGEISTQGGAGGPAGEPVGNQYGTIARGKDGPPGAAGCTKLFAATLRVPPGRLPVAGSLVLGQPLPSDPVPPTSGPDRLYVPATGHTLSGPFLRFWQRFGGLAAFGQPETEAFTDGGRLVQYTDRAMLVLEAGRVQLAPLGRLLTAGRSFPRVAPVPSTATRLYIARTGHTLAGRFLAYWRTHHGAVLLGAPISEVLVAGNGDGSGRRYQLQWFENGRLEYHPEHAGTAYEMQLGLLGVQALERRGWLP